MTAWQLAIKCLAYKAMANANVCEHCGERFEVSSKQTTKRFCNELCQRAARSERRRATAASARSTAS